MSHDTLFFELNMVLKAWILNFFMVTILSTIYFVIFELNLKHGYYKTGILGLE